MIEIHLAATMAYVFAIGLAFGFALGGLAFWYLSGSCGETLGQLIERGKKRRLENKS